MCCCFVCAVASPGISMVVLMIIWKEGSRHFLVSSSVVADQLGVQDTILDLLDKMKDPTTITAEEDEEQMIMRRLRNSVDELQRGYRWLGYRMDRVKSKAVESRYQRERIELMEEMVSIRGEPGSIPQEEETKSKKTGGGRLVYKVGFRVVRNN